MVKLFIILTNLLFISACGTVASNTIHAKDMSIHDIQSCNKSHKPIEGFATIYSKKFEGKKMANGKKFHSSADIVASVVFPLGAKLKITNLQNHKHIYAINADRMNPDMLHKDRVVDLTPHLARKLKVKNGLTKVLVEMVCDN